MGKNANSLEHNRRVSGGVRYMVHRQEVVQYEQFRRRWVSSFACPCVESRTNRLRPAVVFRDGFRANVRSENIGGGWVRGEQDLIASDKWGSRFATGRPDVDRFIANNPRDFRTPIKPRPVLHRPGGWVFLTIGQRRGIDDFQRIVGLLEVPAN